MNTITQPLPAATDGSLASAIIQRSRGFMLPALLAALIAACAAWMPGDLSIQGRVVLACLGLMMVGWTMTSLGDTVVALSAAVALVATGTTSVTDLYASLGNELVWLLIASFGIAAVIRKSGLMELVCAKALGHDMRIRPLFYTLAGLISATAFVIPSTSGRAALLLPVFLAVVSQVESSNIKKALALLFPTTILLSAGASLTGAGAHLVATDFIEKLGGSIGYLGWTLTALPFVALTVLIATEVVLRCFVPHEEISAQFRFVVNAETTTLSSSQTRLVFVILATIMGWMATGLHPLGLGGIAVLGLLAATSPFCSDVNLKTALKSVEWELLIFMAVTLMVGDALLKTDADEWMVSQVMPLLTTAKGNSASYVTLLLIAIATVSHLFVTSRTARATILLPALVVPLSGSGLDAKTMIFIVALGSGYCQTMMASAKPVAIFGKAEGDFYDGKDLLHLSLHLGPAFVAALSLFALVVWPYFWG